MKKYICVNRIMSFGDLTVSRERHCFGIPIDDLTINFFFLLYYLEKSRFHIAVGLFQL